MQKYLRSLAKEKKIPYEWLEREVALARYSPLSEKYTTPKPKADKKTTPEKNFLLYERNLVNTERIVKGLTSLSAMPTHCAALKLKRA